MAEALALVHHYLRLGYPRHAAAAAEEALKRRATSSVDPTLAFWAAFCALMDGRTNEAIRELEGLSRRNDLAFPARIALIHAHQQCKVVDIEEVASLEAQVNGSDEDNASDRARLLAGLVLWHIGETHRSRRQVQYLLRLNPQSTPALTLSGHLALADAVAEMQAQGDPTVHLESAANLFEQAIAASPSRKDLEALMGKTRMLQMREQHEKALDCLNQIVVAYSWFGPALVEKSLVLMAMGDWDQAVETAQRVLSQDKQNIEALRLHTLFLLCREARPSVACTRIADLIEAIDRQEPNNAALYHKSAQPFARLAGGNREVLQLTMTLSGRACKIAPAKPEYLAEYGYQQILNGDFSAAEATLKQAALLEDGAEWVTSHLIKCQIMLDNLDDAEQQLEFVRALGASLDKSPEMSLNAALLQRARGKSLQECGPLLDEAWAMQMQLIKRAPFNYQYYVLLNPELLLEVAQEYLHHCGTDPQIHDDRSPVTLALTKSSKILQYTSEQVPGMLKSQFLLAKAYFLRSDFDGALRCCAHCTKLDPTFSAAALLQAQVLLRTERFKQANSVLEQALSHNFSVGDSPLYYLVKASLLRSEGETEEALALLQKAMSLRAPHDKDQASAAFDRCSIFVMTAELLLELNRLKEAKSLTMKATPEFSGTAQEGRLLIINAKVLVARGKIDAAIKMLQEIKPDSPQYYATRSELSTLQLEHRNDREAFAACHEELVRINPTPQEYVNLGEAYMRISEPDKAVAAFEEALRKSPGDGPLASRIGKVLVTTHEYVKAVDYYLTALDKDPSRARLRYELAELYLELKEHNKALTEVKHLVAEGDKTIDESVLQVKALMLQGRIHEEQDLIPEALGALVQARDVQADILTRVRMESPEQQDTQNEAAAALSYQLATTHELARDQEAALEAYRDVLRYDGLHQKAMLALARLHLSRGEITEAQAEMVKLVRLDPDSEDSHMMLISIMLQRNEWDAAIVQLEDQLNKQPAHFSALSKLLQLLRRMGRLPEAKKHLDAAAKASPRAPLEAGFKYCEGLHHKYMNDPHEALTALNVARRDGEWGEQAVQLMIWIYLNPENEFNWDEIVLDERAPGDPGDAVRAATTLLQELPRSPRKEVLECYILMARKTTMHLEKACAKLIELLNLERDYVPALVCISQAYLMLKQAPKARNHLKRVAKMPFIAEMVDDFERGWLMLSDVYITGGKYDLAEELCKRCLQSNKSCAKAWEYMGVVKEKETAYRDAAAHYENAWKYENETSASVGYKLGFNYLKAKKYVEAIDVCHKVLKHDPDYPKIKSDILEKARQALRT